MATVFLIVNDNLSEYSEKMEDNKMGYYSNTTIVMNKIDVIPVTVNAYGEEIGTEELLTMIDCEVYK